MFGAGRPELQTFMGKHHIHHFYGGFAARNIDSLKALRALGEAEILSICSSMNMPRPAVDRLLEESGIRKKKGIQPSTVSTNKSAKKTRSESESSLSKVQKQRVNQDIEGKKDKEGKTKTEASSYYHFASTPAEEAKKFQPKKITNSDASSKQFNTAIGASKWNPGNTYEDRDYTNLANERWLAMMKQFRWPGSALRVDSFPKLAMDFSIVCTRNKIKYIYDMAFTLCWKGKVGDDKVSGKLHMSDIMPDEEPEDWEWSVTLEKNDAAHQIAKGIIESSRAMICGNLKLLIAQFKEKGG